MAATVLTVSKVISDIISKGMAIHDRLKLVQKNKKSCARLADRVKTVVDPLEVLAKQGVSEEVVQKALDEFMKALEKADALMGKYEKTHWIKKTFNAETLKKDFEEVNQHLSEASHHLSLCLQVKEQKDLAEQREILEHVFNSQRTLKENYEDMMSDLQEWQKLLSLVEETKDVVDSTDRKVSSLQDQMASTQKDVQDIKHAMGAGAASQTLAASSAKATDRVFNCRCELINRIGEASLKTLLDGLQKSTPDMPPVIKGRERNQVLQANCVTEDQVTCLIDMVRKKGERACERFISLLWEEEQELCEELGL